MITINQTSVYESQNGMFWVKINDGKIVYTRPYDEEETARIVASNLLMLSRVHQMGFVSVKQSMARAKRFGAKVEKAEDGKFNFFTHPNNVAFAAALRQPYGEFKTETEAWKECALSLYGRKLI